MRLFRNHPQLRWEHRIHEQILMPLRRMNGELRHTDLVVHHTGYLDPALRERKRARDLRLLLMEYAEQPEHPFTLFNLGMTYESMNRPADALPHLERSLALSDPDASIVRKLYYLIVQCRKQLNETVQALADCQRGRRFIRWTANSCPRRGRSSSRPCGCFTTPGRWPLASCGRSCSCSTSTSPRAGTWEEPRKRSRPSSKSTPTMPTRAVTWTSCKHSGAPGREHEQTGRASSSDEFNNTAAVK